MMKHILLFLTLATNLLPGQEAKKASEIEKKQYQIDLENLPEETRKEYFNLYVRSEQLFGQKRIFECLKTIREAHKIYAKNPATLNLQGACYVEFRAFDKAWKAFNAARKAHPENPNVMFNIAEIEFVTKNWPEALKQLTALKETFAEIDNQRMKDLIDFKILLCQLKTEQTAKAVSTMENLSYKDDTPLFYYGSAALAYGEDRRSDAEAWLARARRVFRDPRLLSPWQDTLIEFGYIKSFYGGDLEIEE